MEIPAAAFARLRDGTGDRACLLGQVFPSLVVQVERGAGTLLAGLDLGDDDGPHERFERLDRVRDAADDGEPADRRHVGELVRDPVEGVGQRGQHGVRDHLAVGGDDIRVGPVDLERGVVGGIGIKQFLQVPIPVMGIRNGDILPFRHLMAPSSRAGRR